MNRNIFLSAVAVLILGSTSAIAQDKPMEKTDEKKVTTTAGTKEYKAGKSIKVLVGKKTRHFALDSKTVSTTVDPAVAVGSKVKIVESKNADGMKTLTVNPAS
jgi:hypothetical protein